MGQISVVHAEESRDFACRLAAALAADGHSIWRSGDGTLSVTRPYADAVVVLWPKEAGPAVIEAARRALARRILIPVAIGDVEPPPSFKHLWPIDLSGWKGDREDPRWQFVRDEIRLALLRNESSPRAPAARARRRSTRRFPALPMKLIVAGVAGSAVVASAAVLLAPAAPADDAKSNDEKDETVVVRLEQQPQEGPRQIRAAPGAAFAEDAETGDADDASETVTVATANEISPSSAERLQPPGIDRQAENGAMPPAATPNEAPPRLVERQILAEADVAPAEEGSGAPEMAPSQSADAPTEEMPAEESADKGSPLEEAVEAEASTPEALAAAAPAAPPLPPRVEDTFTGAVFRDCLDCPDMAEIPAANLGSGLVPVALTLSSYALSRREITFNEWDACVEEGACQYKPADAGWGRGSRPVINVSYADIESYLGWLSEKSGRRYRLPTDAEWTFAARAGAGGPYSFVGEPGPSNANFDGGPGVARTKTVPAASFPPSAYGLYDMHGNVWEWVADCVSDGSSAPAADCAARTVKGGSWNAPPKTLAAEARSTKAPTARDPSTGFRVARDTP